VTDWQRDRIGSALRGENPTVMARLAQSFAVIGEMQWLPGYSVLLVDEVGVGKLSDLTPSGRRDFLAGLDVLGEAVETACRHVAGAFRRVNLEILGNTDAFLHAHVWPRYEWEPSDRLSKPVWLYPPEFWTMPTLQLGPQHDVIRAAITAELLDRA
jgi:diadenosine tetraphosphate (Ap4A) HIT family hydrolase